MAIGGLMKGNTRHIRDCRPSDTGKSKMIGRGTVWTQLRAWCSILCSNPLGTRNSFIVLPSGPLHRGWTRPDSLPATSSATPAAGDAVGHEHAAESCRLWQPPSRHV